MDPSYLPFLQSGNQAEDNGHTTVVDSPKAISENDNDSVLPAYLRIERLPWTPFGRICDFLHSDEDCEDLANLSRASPHLYKLVEEYMNREKNRSAIQKVFLTKYEDGLDVQMNLFPSNVLFHNLDNLDWSRFKRTKMFPIIGVTLRGPEDHINEQVIGLLSARRLWKVYLGGIMKLPSADLPVVERFMRASTINTLLIGYGVTLDDTTAPLFLSIIARVTQRVEIDTGENTQLSDPASFITQLFSSSCSTVSLISTFLSLFGLPHSFWVMFLTEMLSSGSVEYIEVNDRRITTAPIDLPNAPINDLKWKKASK